VIPVDGSQPANIFRVPGGIEDPRWSPDGKGLQYLLTRDGATNIWEQSLVGGEPKQLTKFSSGRIFDFNWSSDRGRLLLTRGNINTNVVLLRNSR
jgi:Tol biopolymer transport system component